MLFKTSPTKTIVEGGKGSQRRPPSPIHGCVGQGRGSAVFAFLWAVSFQKGGQQSAGAGSCQVVPTVSWEEACKEWITWNKRVMCDRRVPTDVSETLTDGWGQQSGCGVSDREFVLIETFKTAELLVRAIASGETKASGIEASFDGIFMACMFEQPGAMADDDEPQDPREELRGGETPDCFVVDSIRDYESLVDLPNTAWPSDVKLRQLEFLPSGSSTGPAASQSSAHMLSALFPGELQLVVNWETRSMSLDCITISPVDQARICAARDPHEFGFLLLGSQQLRFGFSFDDVSAFEVSDSASAVFAGGFDFITMTLSKMPQCTSRVLHSVENKSGNPCTSTPLPERMREWSDCRIVLAIPWVFGRNEGGCSRKQMLVQRLAKAFGGTPEASSGSVAGDAGAEVESVRWESTKRSLEHDTYKTIDSLTGTSSLQAVLDSTQSQSERDTAKAVLSSLQTFLQSMKS